MVNINTIKLFLEYIHSLTDIATNNVGGILENSMKLEEKQKLVVIYDKEFPLTAILAEAYARNRKGSNLIEFSSKPPGKRSKSILNKKRKLKEPLMN